MGIKRIIDVTYFDDALLEIGENIMIYTRDKAETNEYGEIVDSWKAENIWGSLQPDTNSREELDKGSHITQYWNLYCGSEYRIYIDDLVRTNNGDILQVYSYTPWDNFGVREIKCRSIDISEIRNFKEFEEYKDGIKVK